MPIIQAANRTVESYLNYLSFEYDLILARMLFHHKILTLINDSSPKTNSVIHGMDKVGKEMTEMTIMCIHMPVRIGIY